MSPGNKEVGPHFFQGNVPRPTKRALPEAIKYDAGWAVRERLEGREALGAVPYTRYLALAVSEEEARRAVLEAASEPGKKEDLRRIIFPQVPRRINPMSNETSKKHPAKDRVHVREKISLPWNLAAEKTSGLVRNDAWAKVVLLFNAQLSRVLLQVKANVTAKLEEEWQ